MGQGCLGNQNQVKCVTNKRNTHGWGKCVSNTPQEWIRRKFNPSKWRKYNLANKLIFGVSYSCHYIKKIRGILSGIGLIRWKYGWEEIGGAPCPSWKRMNVLCLLLCGQGSALGVKNWAGESRGTQKLFLNTFPQLKSFIGSWTAIKFPWIIQREVTEH